MNVLITGASGRLGTALTRRVSARGHVVRALSRGASQEKSAADWFRADLATGHGLDAAVLGMDAIIHAASDPRHPSLIDVEGTKKLVEAARRAGVAHIVYVSIVGVDVIPYAYYRCKLEAEAIVRGSGVPFSIVRATQFHSFVSWVFESLARVPHVLPVPTGFQAQPVDVTDVADRLTQCLADAPSGRIDEFGGPEAIPVHVLARRWLSARGSRGVVVPVPIPGRLAFAFRQGRNLAPRGERGRMTWDDWLATEFSERNQHGGGVKQAPNVRPTT